MSSSYLCLAFVRMLQLCRLCRAERDELAIEVVMFRHEVLGLRRQVQMTHPALRRAHRAVFAGLGRLGWVGWVRRFAGVVLRWARDVALLASISRPSPVDVSSGPFGMTDTARRKVQLVPG